MQHFRTETVPEHTRQVESHQTCDSCGAVIEDPNGNSVDEITIKRVVGMRWQGDANLDEWDFDCCQACWESKVLPIFALKGDKPTAVVY